MLNIRKHTSLLYFKELASSSELVIAFKEKAVIRSLQKYINDSICNIKLWLFTVKKGFGL